MPCSSLSKTPPRSQVRLADMHRSPLRLARGRRGGPVLFGALCCALFAWPGGGPSAQDQPVDLELVLAVDSSSSVSAEEFDLQMRGLSEAFRNPKVIAALRASGDLGIAVSVIQWSDNRKQLVAVDWMRVRDEATAQRFAEAVGNAPRFLVGGSTAIAGALRFAVRQFETNGFAGRRRVIDVSGDGRANQGAPPGKIRDLAVGRGITINGLAILNEDPMVDGYYFANVIGGTGSFVMTAKDYRAFALAILAKLIKEIAGVPIAARPPRSGTTLAEAAAGTGARRDPARAYRGTRSGSFAASAPKTLSYLVTPTGFEPVLPP
ncbi:MAG: DUF1194 domain-containing protein [Kiloniellaceae bacterium]